MQLKWAACRYSLVLALCSCSYGMSLYVQPIVTPLHCSCSLCVTRQQQFESLSLQRRNHHNSENTPVNSMKPMIMFFKSLWSCHEYFHFQYLEYYKNKSKCSSVKWIHFTFKWEEELSCLEACPNLLKIYKCQEKCWKKQRLLRQYKQYMSMHKVFVSTVWAYNLIISQKYKTKAKLLL